MLRNISDTSITIADSATTIHATHCHRVQLRVAQAQQLRLHHSDFVDFSSPGSTAVMLEDCQSIVVYGSNIHVNDFNWLRTDLPSPNYTHIVVRAESNQEKPAGVRRIPTVQSQTVETSVGTGTKEPTTGTCDDSDDEL